MTLLIFASACLWIPKDEEGTPAGHDADRDADEDSDTGVDTGGGNDTDTSDETASDSDTGSGEDTAQDSEGGADTEPSTDADGDGFDADVDCDDDNLAVNPGASETRGNGVDDDCNGYVDELTVPDAYATIQEAMDAAIDGDTVLVRAGTYRETLLAPETTVTVVGEAGAEATVVDAEAGGAALFLRSTGGKTITIRGLWLANGTSRGGSGGTVACEDGGGPLVLEDAIVSGGSAAYYGGGIGAVECQPITLRRVVVAGNSAANGGGIGAYATEVTAENLLVIANTASAYGGGVLAHSGSASLTHLTAVGNTSGQSGGGVALMADGGNTIVLTNSIVAANTASRNVST